MDRSLRLRTRVLHFPAGSFTHSIALRLVSFLYRMRVLVAFSAQLRRAFRFVAHHGVAPVACADKRIIPTPFNIFVYFFCYLRFAHVPGRSRLLHFFTHISRVLTHLRCSDVVTACVLILRHRH